MSSRMFPCSTISVVVPPSMPAAFRAGSTSTSSTRSKSIEIVGAAEHDVFPAEWTNDEAHACSLAHRSDQATPDSPGERECIVDAHISTY